MGELSDQEAMNLAIQEAKRGIGAVAPNPAVGCVILNSQHQLIATGYHHKCGEVHAEVDAIAQVGNLDLLSGAHVFVTLEPCAHEGRTGSCAKELAKHRLGSLTYGVLDPNPLTSGKGVEILEAAGILVKQHLDSEKACEEVAEVFLHNQREGTVFFALKIAASLDGVITLKSGESQWITSEKSREHSHFLRGKYDAVMIGVGTFLKDDPRLDVRHEFYEEKINRVVLIDPSFRSQNVLATSLLVSVRDRSLITVVCDPIHERSVLDMGFDCLSMSIENSGSFSLDKMGRALYKKGISSVFVEGGGTLISHFLSAPENIQKLYQFIAPKVLGLGGGQGWSSSFSIPNLKNSVDFSQLEVDKIGPDVLLTARLKSTASSPEKRMTDE